MLTATLNTLDIVLRGDETIDPDLRKFICRIAKEGKLPSGKAEERVLRRKAVAEQLGVHPRTIDRYRKTGVLNSVILPGHTRAIGYRLSDVEALLATKNTISVKENSHA